MLGDTIATVEYRRLVFPEALCIANVWYFLNPRTGEYQRFEDQSAVKVLAYAVVGSRQA
jgi:hypothetical protein